MIFFTVFFGVLGFFAACMLIRFWFIVLPLTGVATVVLFLVWLPLAKHANEENMRLYSHPLQESAIGLSQSIAPVQESAEIAARKAHRKAELEADAARQHDFDETYLKEAQAATQQWNTSQASAH